MSLTFGTFGSFGEGTWSLITKACDPATHPKAVSDCDPWQLPVLSAAVRVRSQPDSQLTLLPVGRSDIDDALSLGGKVRATRRQQAGMAEKQCDLIVYTGWLRHVLMSGG